MQIPGEPTAPLRKRLRGAGWTREGPGGRWGRPGRGREPAETCAETTERKGKLHQSHTRPLRRRLGRARRRLGGREGRAGGRDRREGPRAGGVREGAREGGGVVVETAPLHPRPAAVASTAGGAVPGAREASPSPPGSQAPRGRRGQGSPRELSSSSALVPAVSPHTVPRSELRSPGTLDGSIQPPWPVHSTCSTPLAGALNSRLLSACCVRTRREGGVSG